MLFDFLKDIGEQHNINAEESEFVECLLRGLNACRIKPFEVMIPRLMFYLSAEGIA